MCEVVAERMKWSRDVEKLIVNLVRWHLRPGALFHHGDPTERAGAAILPIDHGRFARVDSSRLRDFGATRGPGLMGENRLTLENSLFDLLKGYVVYKEEFSRRRQAFERNRRDAHPFNTFRTSRW